MSKSNEVILETTMGIPWAKIVVPYDWLRFFAYKSGPPKLPHCLVKRCNEKAPFDIGLFCWNEQSLPPRSPEFHIQSEPACFHRLALAQKTVYVFMYTDGGEKCPKTEAPFAPWCHYMAKDINSLDTPIPWSEEDWVKAKKDLDIRSDMHNTRLKEWEKNPDTLPNFENPSPERMATIRYSESMLAENILLGKVKIVAPIKG